MSYFGKKHLTSSSQITHWFWVARFLS